MASLDTVIAHPDRASAAEALADRVAGELARALAAGGRARLAVPGGRTPRDFLRALATRELDWARVDILPGDDRWLGEADPRSNGALLRDALAGTPAAAARRLALVTEDATPELGAAAVEAALAAALGRPARLDVAVLGVGEDGHTASLFPNGDHLAQALAPDCPHIVRPMRAPGAAEPRITLTLPVLAGAGALHILAFGEGKRAALTRAAESAPDAAPIRAIAEAAARPPSVYWAP